MPSMQERLWRAMRIRRSFKLKDLTLVTETTLDYAGKYVHVLRRSGFLNERGDRFVLVRDSGPKPPQVLFHYEAGQRHRVGALDRNTKTTYGLDGNAPPKRREPVKTPLGIRHRSRKAAKR